MSCTPTTMKTQMVLYALEMAARTPGSASLVSTAVITASPFTRVVPAQRRRHLRICAVLRG